MSTALMAIKPGHPLYREPPPESVEHVYSAIEYPVGEVEKAVPIVCYRTKDGMTHQAEVKTVYHVRKSVPPLKR